MLTELMDQLEDINQHFQPSGLSLLSIAVAEEALECVKVLLEAGAEPNQWDLSGKMTALHPVAQTSLHTLYEKDISTSFKERTDKTRHIVSYKLILHSSVV